MLTILPFFILGCGNSQQQQGKQEDKTLSSKVAVHKITADETGTASSDVVCGMKVTVTNMTPAVEYDGKTYFFCSQHCRDTFAAHPDEYESGEEEESGHEHDNM